jgi:hypothetical protein
MIDLTQEASPRTKFVQPETQNYLDLTSLPPNDLPIARLVDLPVVSLHLPVAHTLDESSTPLKIDAVSQSVHRHSFLLLLNPNPCPFQ